MHDSFHKVDPVAKLRTLAPKFNAPDHTGEVRSLPFLMGDSGLLLGFVNDIALTSTIRRAQWLQSHHAVLQRLGLHVALVIPNQPHTLANFYTSCPVPPDFTLLADDDRTLHRLFQLNRRAGLVLIARDLTVIAQWAVPEEKTWPDLAAIMYAAELL